MGIVVGKFMRAATIQDVPATLSSEERARLKARAHALDPVVRMGHAGVTPELVAEVDRALTAHGLIKVGIAVDDRDDRRGTPVHRVGKVLTAPTPSAESAHPAAALPPAPSSET
jgi:RNA-binding protein YhbY